MNIKKIAFALMFSAVALTQQASAATSGACDATGVIMNYPISKFWLDVSVNGAAPVKVNFATQANTTFVAPATTFENGQTVSYTGTYDATGTFCNADTMTVMQTLVAEPSLSCSGVDQVITNAANVRAAILEIGGGPSNGGMAVQIAQNSTTIMAPLTASTFFAAGNLISFVGTMSAANLCVATAATISAPVVIVPDTTAPTITMNGTDMSLTVGDVYVDAGATCTDDIDTVCEVVTTSTVDTTVPGTYTVTYAATDVAGNVASPVIRTVTISAPVPTYTSTGKKVETTGVIAEVSSESIMVKGVVVRITSTAIVKGQLVLGKKVEYKGFLNTDGSVSATSVKLK